jgi:hypothetical protein
MSDNSDSSASSTSADDGGSVDPVSPADTGPVSADGEQSEVASGRGRRSWNTFPFKRKGGLERRAPTGPEEFNEQDTAG